MTTTVSELIAVKKYLARWRDRRFIVVVMHNDDLAQGVESVDYAGGDEPGQRE